MKNERVFALDAVDDDVLVYKKAAKARTQIVIAPPPDLRMQRQQPEALCDGVDEAAGNVGATALAGNVQPNAVKLVFGFRLPVRDETRSSTGILSGDVLSGIEAGKAALLYLICELRRFLSRRNPAAIAPRKRSLGLIDSRKDFGTAALAAFPQR